MGLPQRWCGTHASQLPRPGARELGNVYTNAGQSLVEGCPCWAGEAVIVLNCLAPLVASQAPAERLPAELQVRAVGGPAPYTGLAGPGRAQQHTCSRAQSGSLQGLFDH